MKHRDCRFSKGCTIPFFCALFPPGRMVFAEDPCHARLCAPVFSLTNCAVVWWVLSNRDTTLLSVQWNQEWAGPLLQRWHVMQGRVMTGCCVLLFGVRARPPHWLHYLLATLPCTNHLALLTRSSIVKCIQSVYMFMVAIIKKYYHQKLTESMFWVTEMLDCVTFNYITHSRKREQL